jgi:hypothetical protein
MGTVPHGENMSPAMYEMLLVYKCLLDHQAEIERSRLKLANDINYLIVNDPITPEIGSVMLDGELFQYHVYPLDKENPLSFYLQTPQLNALSETQSN